MKIKFIQTVFICLSFVLLTFTGIAQKKDTISFNLDVLTPLIIKLPAPSSNNYLPVNNIEIIDRRFDSTIDGCYKDLYLKLEGGTCQAIKKYLAGSFRFAPSGDTSKTILVVIKKFWINNHLVLVPPQKFESARHNGSWKPWVVCKMECIYKQGDIFYPLFRLDTTVISEKRSIDNATELVTDCLNRLQEKINMAVGSLKNTGTKWDLQKLNDYYNKRFNLPVLSGEPIKKGLYKNFTSFQNNQPFCTSFSVKNGTLEDELFTTDSLTGLETLQREIWGYSDGSRFYVKAADNYFPLVRMGNSFYTRGFQELEVVLLDSFGRPLGMTGYLVPGQSYMGYGKGAARIIYKVSYNNYQLDMENGQLF